MKGKIVKGIAGFYYVHVNDCGIFECKAKGVFRKDHKKPLVGDDVLLQILDEDKKLGTITQILERSSELIRPAVANVDQALVVFSIVKPQPNFNLLDRFLIMIRQQKLPCIICFNKLDMDEDNSGLIYEQIYRQCGYKTILVSAGTGYGIPELKELLKGKTTTVAGPSGVGKSSLINCLQSKTLMETGSISSKIERGKHTTRHSEIIAIEEDSYIFDTPGFSSLSLFDLEAEELLSFYPEFAEYEQDCRFRGCSHIGEPVCGIKKALLQGKISKMRYDNYALLYTELKEKRKYK